MTLPRSTHKKLDLLLLLVICIVITAAFGALVVDVWHSQNQQLACENNHGVYAADLDACVKPDGFIWRK